MNIVPALDRIIVQRDSRESTTRAGIILPKNSAHAPTTGIVGPAVKSGLKPNTRVVFSAYAGTAVSIDGRDILIMREDDIMAVLTP